MKSHRSESRAAGAAGGVSAEVGEVGEVGEAAAVAEVPTSEGFAAEGWAAKVPGEGESRDEACNGEDCGAAALGALREAAAQLGFSALGVAAPDAPQGETLQRWLQEGCHAGMRWMERHLEARLNPQLVLPGVRSVVMLTYEYAREDAFRGGGHIARYAQGEDYHKLLAGKLADLDETLQFYGGRQRGFTDSGPISERFFARMAGLGWLGRNGLLLRERGGSYCFLASLLTTLELPRSTPQANRCGRCRRCEEACPTGALRDGGCDARLCLSYWTIEAHEPAPDAIEAARRDRLYGCDICQEVCPWNRPRPAVQRMLPPTDPHLLMPARLSGAPRSDLAEMSDEAFENFFRQSPIRRIGAEHWRRNLRSPGEEGAPAPSEIDPA